MNLEKHVKTPFQELMLADSNLTPRQARSSHIVGHYVKDRHLRYRATWSDGSKPVPLMMRLDGLPAEPAIARTGSTMHTGDESSASSGQSTVSFEDAVMSAIDPWRL